MLNDLVKEAGIPDELYDLIYNNAPTKKYKKGEIILDNTNSCDYIYFVEEGFLRLFYINDNGVNISHVFAAEDGVITSLPSFFDRTKSKFFIEALEDSTVKLMTHDRMKILCDSSHECERFARLFTQKILLEQSLKIEELQFKSAKERYTSLIERYPTIFQRAKLGHIASYIGITPQSLSRIRADF